MENDTIFKKFLGVLKKIWWAFRKAVKKAAKEYREEQGMLNRSSEETITYFKKDLELGRIPVHIYGIRTTYDKKPYLKFYNIKVYSHVHYSYYEGGGYSIGAGYGKHRITPVRTFGSEGTVNYYKLEKGAPVLIFDRSGSYLDLGGKKHKLVDDCLISRKSLMKIPFNDREARVFHVSYIEKGQRVEKYIEMIKPEFYLELINTYRNNIVDWNAMILDEVECIVKPKQ